jgi:hypothetical protein
MQRSGWPQQCPTDGANVELKGIESERYKGDSIVDMVFHLKWKSDAAIHTDGYQASRINVWRDYLPPLLLDKMSGRQAGERIEVRPNAGDVVPLFDKKNLFKVRSNQFWTPLQNPGLVGSIPRAC